MSFTRANNHYVQEIPAGYYFYLMNPKVLIFPLDHKK